MLFNATIASAVEDTGAATRCHCFQERSFDLQNKYAADSYLLTTNFNSFIAANFHISKSQIVMMKMKGGVEPDDLLIALYVARACHVKLNVLLAILDNGGNWQQILESESILKQGCSKDVFGDHIDIDKKKEVVVGRVTGQLLKEYYGVLTDDIIALRKKGASDREIALLFNLERYGGIKRNAAEILEMYRQQHMSWGEIAQSYGLSPEETGKIFLQEGSLQKPDKSH
ncbi:MAG: hypothetical protein KKD01_14470 [Proteobacteria bacterium]|nr:hypothetical protein [Pseudomonadota bacterium]MBU1418024.1 hypothetical protein [Pseudomonadota bacterium]MBU1455925.1 hypothetical protein [Pseudomonadota bacterium]